MRLELLGFWFGVNGLELRALSLGALHRFHNIDRDFWAGFERTLC